MVDFATLSIVLVLLGAFCTPFIYAHYKKAQQEKQLIRSFLGTAKDQQLNIHAYELWRRTYVIGLDKDLLRLMYIKFHPQTQMSIVDLKKIKNVGILNEHMLVGEDKQIVIDKLGLLFIHEDPLLSDIYLEFFNAAVKDDPLGEPTLIQRWHKLLEVTISDYQKKSSEKYKGAGHKSLPASGNFVPESP